MTELDPQELFDQGVEHAYESNEALKKRDQAAEHLLKVSGIVEPTVSDEVARQHYIGEIRMYNNLFETFSTTAGRLLDQGTPPEQRQLSPDQILHRPEFWDQLSKEQQEFAVQAELALIKKYALRSSEVGLVLSGKGGSKQVFVMHTGESGIQLGSGEEIMSRWSDKNFKILIGGKTAAGLNDENVNLRGFGKYVDTRAGMTMPLYEALIKQAKDRGDSPLPDSTRVDIDENGNKQLIRGTRTLLTGEKAVIERENGAKEIDEKRIPFATVFNGEPRRGLEGKKEISSNLRFRPVVPVGPLAKARKTRKKK